MDEIVQDRVLTRGDMTKPGALATFQDKGQVGKAEISMGASRGGARFENMMQVMEFARMMALADVGVPQFLRGNPGACLRIAMQADEWGFSPFAVADKAYKVGDRMAYESQLVHAVIERRAPLDGRLRMEYFGEGPTRRCRVIGRMIGENDPFIWDGPEFQQIKVKNSPEWTANPDKQLWYHASRDWARIYCPDVLLGVYTRDELDNSELGPNRARAVSDLSERLPQVGKGGYDAQGIAETLAEARGEVSSETHADHQGHGEANPEPSQGREEVIDSSTGEVTSATPAEPATKEEYSAYAERWISSTSDKDNAEARWDGERELRGKCKVSVTERKRLEKMLNEKFA